MKIVLQRVSSASVTVNQTVVGQISKGYLLLVCVLEGDSDPDAVKLADKICALRLWDGEDGKINDRSILDIGGDALVVSQFTLAGDTKKGRRPDYTAAAKPDTAKPLVDRFVSLLKEHGVGRVEQGVFGADMTVTLVNDGPVTLILESR